MRVSGQFYVWTIPNSLIVPEIADILLYYLYIYYNAQLVLLLKNGLFTNRADKIKLLKKK